MSEIRQRAPSKDPPTDSAPAVHPPSPAALAKAEDSSFSILDLLRGVVFVLLISSALSYFITRDNFFWNLQRPKFTHYSVLKSYFTGPQQLTDADLKKYDGSDPNLPIYLAINGTIYDVSAGRRHYGPGGSYHFFAGADASRAFVTNCFKEDITPDMRGVEEMFIPMDNREVDMLYTSGELKALKEQEMRQAKAQVHKALKHWVDFFEKSGKYTKVGRVKRKEGWEGKARRKLCAAAQERRPKSREKPVREGM